MVFELGGGDVSEAAVTAPSVVKGSDVIEGDELGRGTGGREAIAEASGLEVGDEASGEGVVAGVGDAAHAAALAKILEIEPHPQAAVGAAARGKALSGQRSQFGILAPPRSPGFAAMRGKAALADF